MPGGRPARQHRLRLAVGAAALTVLAPLLAVSSPPPARALAPTPSVEQVKVVLVLPPGAVADGTTVDDLTAVVNGPVADYWRAESGGMIDIQASAGAPGWITTTAVCNPYDQYELFNAVLIKVFGYTFPLSDHLLLYIPPTTGGGGPANCQPDGYGTDDSRVGNGGELYVRTTSVAQIVRQLGHNFGLDNPPVFRATPGDRATVRIGEVADQDPFDIMSSAALKLGSLSAPHQAELGGLPASQILDVPMTPGVHDVTINPLGLPTGIRAARLPEYLGSGGVYWFEFRSPTGPDAWLGTADDTQGLGSSVVVRQGGTYWPLLLDASATEESAWTTDRQVALTAGSSMYIGSDLYVTVRSMSATEAHIRINVGKEPFPRDQDGDGHTDVVAADRAGGLYRYPVDGNALMGPRVMIGRGWQTRDLITTAGGWDGPGTPEDIIAREPATGNLWLYSGSGHGVLRPGRLIGHGWQAMNALFSPGDWDGDGNVDLIARRTDGALFLYSGNGVGGFAGVRQIGRGWNGMGFAATGSYTTRAPDFCAFGADGNLYLYVGDGHGGFVGRRVLNTHLPANRGVTGVGKWFGGYGEVMAIDGAGRLQVYHGYPDGDSFSAPNSLGSGWTGYRLAS